MGIVGTLRAGIVGTLRAGMLVSLCVLTRVAHADGEPKSDKLATVLSTVPTLIGYATVTGVLASGKTGGGARVVFAFGGTLAIAGPSFGNFYAENYRPAGLTMRSTALGIAFVGMFVVAAECEDLEPCPGYPVGKVFLGSAVMRGATTAIGASLRPATASH